MIQLHEAKRAAGPGGPVFMEFWIETGRMSAQVTERRLLESAERRYQRLSGLRSTEVAAVKWPGSKSEKRMHLAVAFGPNLMRLGRALLLLSGGAELEVPETFDSLRPFEKLAEALAPLVPLTMKNSSAAVDEFHRLQEGSTTELTDESEKLVPGEAKETILAEGAAEPEPVEPLMTMGAWSDLDTDSDSYQQQIAEANAEIAKALLGK